MKKLFLYIVREKDQEPLAGLAPAEWLKKGVYPFPYREIEDDAEAEAIGGYEYIAILHSSTPLLTAPHLTDLIEEMEKRGVDGLEIGRGKIQREETFARGIAPKRKCLSPFARRISDAISRSEVEKALYRKNAEECAQNGVIIFDLDAVKIDANSIVEAGATIEPYCLIERSVVRKGAHIGSFSELINAEIGEGASVTRSTVRDSKVGAGATIGPFAYLRMGSGIGEKCRVGDFVEVKASKLGAGAKSAHLAYIGDAAVGEKTNVGCGAVFANYDGKDKHRTSVGNAVFIGANTNLVAPVSVGDGAYIAAATTVTKDVPAGAFVIGRVREEQKEKRKG